VDGERPLKFPIENLVLYRYLTPKDILRAFHKKNYDYEFNPDTEKVADIVPQYFFYKCPSGESYEMGFPKGADMMPPEGYYALLEAFEF